MLSQQQIHQYFIVLAALQPELPEKRRKTVSPEQNFSIGKTF
jgi:hypothetical protein